MIFEFRHMGNDFFAWEMTSFAWQITDMGQEIMRMGKDLLRTINHFGRMTQTSMRNVFL